MKPLLRDDSAYPGTDLLAGRYYLVELNDRDRCLIRAANVRTAVLATYREAGRDEPALGCDDTATVDGDVYRVSVDPDTGSMRVSRAEAE